MSDEVLNEMESLNKLELDSQLPKNSVEDEIKSNITGVAWQEAKEKAEEYVQIHGFPGVEPLAKKIKCSKGTMQKAIENSQILQEAKSQKKKKTSPKTESIYKQDQETGTLILNENIYKESNRPAPDLEAEINILLSEKSEEKLVEGIIKYEKKIDEDESKNNPSHKHKNEEELRAELKKHSKEEIAQIYLSLKETADEIHADDPTKSGHRRRA